MALNATKRKSLKAVLQASSRARVSDEDLEAIANQLIEEKTTLDEAAETYNVSKATLKKRLAALADPEQATASAAS